jgi:hypothetical protein
MWQMTTDDTDLADGKSISCEVSVFIRDIRGLLRLSASELNGTVN